MKKSKGFVVFVLSLLLGLLSMTSMQNLLAVGQDQHPYGGTITIGIKDEPEIFNPIMKTYGRYTAYYIQLLSRLVTMDKEYKIVPDLAERWEIDDNGRKYTFHLVRNGTWHDGKPFTSEDVKFYYELLMGRYPELWNGSSPTKARMKDLISVEAPDAYTVVFTFENAVLPWIFAAPGQADTLILPKHIWSGMDIRENPANQNPIGTGPFKFVEYVPGSHLILVANEEYFKGRPYLDKLIYKVIKTDTAALLCLYKGEIDAVDEMLGVPLEEIPKLQANPAFGISARPYDTIWYLHFNCRDIAIEENPWLANRDARMAIINAIDVDAIIATQFYNATTRINSPISSMIQWAYNPDLPTPKYDPDLAEQLLDNAGYPRGSDGVRFKAEMVVRPHPTSILGAEPIQYYLREVGIEIDLNMPDYGTFVSQYAQNPEIGPVPMILHNRACGPDPDIATSGWHSECRPPDGYNFIWYNNSEVDKLLEQQSQTADYDKRAELLREFQRVFMEDAWVFPLWHYILTEAWSNDFAGFETHQPVKWFTPYTGVYWTKGVISPPPQPPYELYAGVIIVSSAIIVAAAYWYRKRKV